MHVHDNGVCSVLDLSTHAIAKNRDESEAEIFLFCSVYTQSCRAVGTKTQKAKVVTYSGPKGGTQRLCHRSVESSRAGMLCLASRAAKFYCAGDGGHQEVMFMHVLRLGSLSSTGCLVAGRMAVTAMVCGKLL